LGEHAKLLSLNENSGVPRFQVHALPRLMRKPIGSSPTGYAFLEENLSFAPYFLGWIGL